MSVRLYNCFGVQLEDTEPAAHARFVHFDDHRAVVAKLEADLAYSEQLVNSLQNRWASRDLTIERLRAALTEITMHSVCCDARHTATAALSNTGNSGGSQS